MPGHRPAKLCLCIAAQCCADALQIPAIPWPSFSFLRSALPPRFGTMPVRNTAMPWLHISLPAPPCSVLCPGYAAHIRRSTILCRRISVQSLGSALPVYASAGQISTQPCHTVALPSYALPQPCSTIPWHRFALLFPGIALLHSDAPCQDRTAQLSAFPFPCFSVQCYAQAFRCYALPVQCHALPKRFLASPFNANADHLFALPGLRRASPCPALAAPLYAMPCHCPSLHCHRKSMHFLSSSPQCIAVPVQLNALPGHVHALPVRIFS